jgi:hypothetical protein
MCNCNSAKEPEDLVNRRNALKRLLLIAGGALVGLLSIVMPSKKVEAGYGRCSMCACPQYYGSGNVCSNCGHSYSAHW